MYRGVPTLRYSYIWYFPHFYEPHRHSEKAGSDSYNFSLFDPPILKRYLLLQEQPPFKMFFQPFLRIRAKIVQAPSFKRGGGVKYEALTQIFEICISWFLINLIVFQWYPVLHPISSTLLLKANICSSLPWPGIATKSGKRWGLMVFYLLLLSTFKLHNEL